MIGNFLILCSLYCEQKGIAEGTLSYWLFNNGSILNKLRNGNTITIRSYERAVGWLSEHWPEDKAWPDFIERPDIFGKEEVIHD